jgi:hypothetical protein
VAILHTNTNSNTTTSTTNTTDGHNGYTLFMDGANHRGNFTKIRKACRSVLKHVFRVRLQPQADLEPCTECTLSTTKHGRYYKHILYIHILMNCITYYMCIDAHSHT